MPTTSGGRFAGFMLMVVGLAALGTVAGALTSMFGGAAEEAEDPSPDPAEELADIKQQLAEVNAKLDELSSRLP